MHTAKSSAREWVIELLAEDVLAGSQTDRCFVGAFGGLGFVISQEALAVGQYCLLVAGVGWSECDQMQ